MFQICRINYLNHFKYDNHYSNFESSNTDTVGCTLHLLWKWILTFPNNEIIEFLPLERGCNMGKVSGSPGESIDLKASGLCRSSLLFSQCGFSSSLSVPEQSKNIFSGLEMWQRGQVQVPLTVSRKLILAVLECSTVEVGKTSKRESMRPPHDSRFLKSVSELYCGTNYITTLDLVKKKKHSDILYI